MGLRVSLRERGGLPYEWGGVAPGAAPGCARYLAYGCKFRILVSRRVYIALVTLPE